MYRPGGWAESTSPEHLPGQSVYTCGRGRRSRFEGLRLSVARERLLDDDPKTCACGVRVGRVRASGRRSAGRVGPMYVCAYLYDVDFEAQAELQVAGSGGRGRRPVSPGSCRETPASNSQIHMLTILQRRAVYTELNDCERQSRGSYGVMPHSPETDYSQCIPGASTAPATTTTSTTTSGSACQYMKQYLWNDTHQNGSQQRRLIYPDGIHDGRSCPRTREPAWQPSLSRALPIYVPLCMHAY